MSEESLYNAWNKFRRGKGKRSDVITYSRNLRANIAELSRALQSATFQHEPYAQFRVCDPKQRVIHKASVRDRIVHQSIVTALEVTYDKQFIHDSYSCRVGKGTHAGVRRFTRMLRKRSRNNTRTVYVLKCDIRKFFASVDHLVLLQLLDRGISDPKVRLLVSKVVLNHGGVEGKGIPLGNVSSQLFANIYMHEFDRYVKHTLRYKHYIRYCDDFVILHESRKYLLAQIPLLQEFLFVTLKLELHPEKTSIGVWSQGIDFLGYVNKPGAILLRTTARKRMLAKITRKNIGSYAGVCGHANAYKTEQLIRTMSWGGDTAGL